MESVWDKAGGGGGIHISEITEVHMNWLIDTILLYVYFHFC